MAGIKVKPQFANKVIGFNHSSLPLGQRDDLHLLYENAKRKGHKAHLNMFEVDEDAISAEKSSTFLKKQDDKKS